MKTVTGKITGSTPVTIAKAASILSKFVFSETGASQALNAYLRRATAAFDELSRLHSKSDRRKHKKDSTLIMSEEASQSELVNYSEQMLKKEVKGEGNCLTLLAVVVWCCGSSWGRFGLALTVRGLAPASDLHLACQLREPANCFLESKVKFCTTLFKWCFAGNKDSDSERSAQQDCSNDIGLAIWGEIKEKREMNLVEKRVWRFHL
ncbi:hypothetical protein SADUNF_Sadunf19G0098900 [Salix dunnii]|uniref:Uncharacterized protein n=1 Tax=Salix dunnii TaxID=1413687 RepID=A0A835MFK2_9ROSI|nr:hypothetical protein SADUNF_Sadunf19G0098900 [Salix dunnii]